MPPLNTKTKFITAEIRMNQPVKSDPCKSKKKLSKKLLFRQDEKQGKENKSSGDHMTLNERFNMLEVTVELKRLCPNVKREYFTYQPMTDMIYTKWERTRTLKDVLHQQNYLPLLDNESNQSKLKLRSDVVSSTNSYPELVKLPLTSGYTISPLLLRKDIAAIVTDNVSIEEASNATKAIEKRSNISPIVNKDSACRKNWLVKKKENTGKEKNSDLSVNRCPSIHPDLVVEERSQSPTPFELFSKVAASKTWVTNLLFDKEKAWNRDVTETELKTTKGLLLRKLNLSILSPTFGQDSKNEDVSKPFFLGLIRDDMDSLKFSHKETTEADGNRTPNISLWHCP